MDIFYRRLPYLQAIFVRTSATSIPPAVGETLLINEMDCMLGGYRVRAPLCLRPIPAANLRR
jgi:hypothetical protein